MVEVGFDTLCLKFSKNAGLSKEIASSFVKSIVDAIISCLGRRKRLLIPELGTFIPISRDGSFTAIETLKIYDVPEIKAMISSPAYYTTFQRQLSFFAQTIRDTLLSGERIYMRDFGYLEIKIKKFLLESENQIQLRSPPSVQISFQFLPRILTDYDISFIPEYKLEQALKDIRVSLIMSFAPEKDFLMETVEFYYTKRKFPVRFVSDPYDAYGIFLQEKPQIVVLDSRFINSLELSTKIKLSKYSWQPFLITLFSEQTQSLITNPTGVIVSGDVNLFEPYEFIQLRDVINRRIVYLANTDNVPREINIISANTEECREYLIDMLTKLMKSDDLSEKAQITFPAAIREAIENARVHGNKGLPNKKITVNYLSNQRKIQITVSDEGKGFDYSPYLKTGIKKDVISVARDRYISGLSGGLGLTMMLKYSDSLEYNEQGNQVKLTKYLET